MRPAHRHSPVHCAGVKVGILGGTGPRVVVLPDDLPRPDTTCSLAAGPPERAELIAAEYGQTQGSGLDRRRRQLHAAAAELVIVTVPYDGHADLLSSWPPSWPARSSSTASTRSASTSEGHFRVRVAAGSAAQEAQQLLPESTVIAAFHHVSAVLLDDPAVEHFADDVLVLGEDREAVAVVCELATAIPGARGIYAGRLRNAGQVEALTANLIAINRRYKTHAGLAITGVS